MGVLKPDFESKKLRRRSASRPARGIRRPRAQRSSSSSRRTRTSTRWSCRTTTTPTRSSPICKSIKIPPKTFPTTGQDATLTGLQNVLYGYQCGTVYKPIYLEAQAAAAARPLPARGREAAGRLVNGSTMDTQAEEGGRLRSPEADLGDAEEHGLDGRQGRLRQGFRALRRRHGERLQGGRHPDGAVELTAC